MAELALILHAINIVVFIIVFINYKKFLKYIQKIIEKI